MDKQKKKLRFAILVIALIQMSSLALSPGINQIATTAFPDLSLAAVQTALSLSGLSQPIAAFLAAILINRRLVTKRAIIIFGLCLLAGDGLVAILFHTEFWHLLLLSVILGVSTGAFMSNIFGLIFDNFEPLERQSIVGIQTSFINFGGIMMSLLGGVLATYFWYGGYLILFIGLPAAILVYYTVPSYKVPLAERKDKNHSRKLKPKIYYYCVVALMFMMTYVVCGSNISTHIAGLGNSATAGIAVAVMMSGGVVSGAFFGKLSTKIGDYSMTLALLSVFVGYMMLSVFTSSLIIVFIAVLLVGMSLSIVLPRCIYMVSTFATDPSNAATATALVSVASPSIGSFLSPIILTNLTTAMFGHSTALRFRFVGFIVLVLAIVVTIVTMLENRRSLRK